MPLMDFTVDVDAGKVNEMLSRAVLESAIGGAIQEAIQAEIRLLEDRYSGRPNPIQMEVRKILAREITTILQAEYREVLQKAVRDKLTDAVVEEIVGAAFEAFVRTAGTP